jgi:Cu(I)/Ag(I) efflux system protein CusF
MKNLKNLLILTAMLSGSPAVFAASHGGAPTSASDVKKETTPTAPADMAQGEIRKVDMESKKITIKHGEIKNLDMPGMTMVFQVKEDALLGKAKVGDKVRFTAEKIGGAIVVTDIQPAK